MPRNPLAYITSIALAGGLAAGLITRHYSAQDPPRFILYETSALVRYINANGDLVIGKNLTTRGTILIEGFDIIEQNNALEGFHEIFKTRDGDYIVHLGASFFYIDATGKLRTEGGHRLIKQDNTLFTGYGTNIHPLCASPTSFRNLAFLRDGTSDERYDYYSNYFEERDNGLYARIKNNLK